MLFSIYIFSHKIPTECYSLKFLAWLSLCGVLSIDKYSTLIITFETSSVEYIFIQIPSETTWRYCSIQKSNLFALCTCTLKFELIPYESRTLKRSMFNQLSGGSKLICVRRTNTEKMKNHPYRKNPRRRIIVCNAQQFFVRKNWVMSSFFQEKFCSAMSNTYVRDVFVSVKN